MSSPKAQQQAYKPFHGILQQLNDLKRSLPDFPNQLADLLSGKEYEDPAFSDRFRYKDSLWLIEYLDDVRVSFSLYALPTERA